MRRHRGGDGFVVEHLVEHEQQGQDRATYGKATLKHLAVSLTAEFGRGFSERATVARWGGATIRALSTATTKPEGGHALVIAEHVIRAKSRRG